MLSRLFWHIVAYVVMPEYREQRRRLAGKPARRGFFNA